MWVTVQGYARSTAQTILAKHDGQAVPELEHAKIFGPETAKSIRRLQAPISDTLLTYTTLAYANDCLTAMLLPIAAYLPYGKGITGINVNPLIPVLKPLAEYYATTNGGPYSAFFGFTKKSLLQFMALYCGDKRLFGMANRETNFTGIRLCVYAAILQGDKTYFATFAEQVFMALFDKAVALTGTQNECAGSRADCKAMIQKGFSLYDNAAQQHQGAPSQQPAPASIHRVAEEVPEVIPVESGKSDPANVLEETKSELEKLIGLPRVKEEVKKLTAFLAVQKERKKYRLPTSTQTLHVFV
jgi:hypothetical protein